MRQFNRGLLFTVLTAVGPSVWAAGGLYSQVTVLTEPTPVADNHFGEGQFNGVALSADGHTALVSAIAATVGAASAAGKAYIFHYVNGKWTMSQEIDDPDASAGDQFGSALAISADGNSVLIGSGATVTGQQHAGKAYLYTLANGLWTESHEFDDPAATAYDYFGYYSLALSGDGATAIIGASAIVNGNSGAGEVYIFSETNDIWTQTAAIPDPDNHPADLFGLPVAVSADGHSALVGSLAAVNGQINAGKAYLYILSNGVWTQAHEFDDPGATTGDGFGGTGVALSADGTTVIIGSSATVNAQTYAGKAYIFSKANGMWSEVAAISDPDAAQNDYFSLPVAISANGTSALFGSRAAVNGQQYAGKAYLYTLNNGTWTRAHEFDDPTATGNDHFGSSGVAISADGMAALISAWGMLSATGEAYAYQSPIDLSLALAADPATVTLGQQSTLEFTVTNTDSALTANNLSLSNTLPSGLGYVSANAGGGSCTASGGAVSCTLATLAPGKAWQPSVTVTTSSSGSFTDTANITSNEPDPDMPNNKASTQVTVNAVPQPASPSSGGGAGGGGFDILGLGLLAALLTFAQWHRARR